MIDDMAGLDVIQRFKRQTAAFFFVINPGSQGLLDDSSRAIVRDASPIGRPFGQATVAEAVM